MLKFSVTKHNKHNQVLVGSVKLVGLDPGSAGGDPMAAVPPGPPGPADVRGSLRRPLRSPITLTSLFYLRKLYSGLNPLHLFPD